MSPQNIINLLQRFGPGGLLQAYSAKTDNASAHSGCLNTKLADESWKSPQLLAYTVVTYAVMVYIRHGECLKKVLRDRNVAIV